MTLVHCKLLKSEEIRDSFKNLKLAPVYWREFRVRKSEALRGHLSPCGPAANHPLQSTWQGVCGEQSPCTSMAPSRGQTLHHQTNSSLRLSGVGLPRGTDNVPQGHHLGFNVDESRDAPTTVGSYGHCYCPHEGSENCNQPKHATPSRHKVSESIKSFSN